MAEDTVFVFVFFVPQENPGAVAGPCPHPPEGEQGHSTLPGPLGRPGTMPRRRRIRGAAVLLPAPAGTPSPRPSRAPMATHGPEGRLPSGEGRERDLPVGKPHGVTEGATPRGEAREHATVDSQAHATPRKGGLSPAGPGAPPLHLGGPRRRPDRPMAGPHGAAGPFGAGPLCGTCLCL